MSSAKLASALLGGELPRRPFDRLLAAALVVVLMLGCAPTDSSQDKLDGLEVRTARARAAEILGAAPTAAIARERFDADGRFAYIEIRNREPGRLTTRVAVEPEGKVTPLAQVERAFAARHRASWGALELESARWLKASPTCGGRVHLIGEYGSESTPAEILSRLRGIDAAASVSTDMPLFELHVRNPEIARSLARESWVRVLRVVRADLTDKDAVAYPPPVPASEYIPSTSLTTESDLYANSAGVYGSSVRVGVFESYLRQQLSVFSGCRLDEAHESLANLSSIAYQQPALSCTGDTQCEWCGGVQYGRCINGVCVDAHASQVASRIAASQEAAGNGAPAGAFHAGRTNLFVEHNRTSTTSLTQAETEAAYQWFDSNAVRLVNLSFGSTNGGVPSHIGVRADWYARNKQFIVVHSAGNKSTLGNVNYANTAVTCDGFTSICVGSLSALATAPRNRAEYWTSAESRWRNVTANDWEFEKPDVMAEGSSAQVMEVGGVDSWDTNTGTSFAAPTVTGLIALHLDFCEKEPGVRDSAFYRAFLRSISAFDPSPVESFTSGGAQHVDSCPASLGGTPLYPAPHLGCDHHGGAGPVSAKYMFRDLNTCGVIDDPECMTPPCPVSGTGVLETESGWSAVPAWAQSNNPGNNQNTQALRITDAYFIKLKDLGSFDERSRLRATFAYYACPASTSSAPADGAPAVNFDLALVGTRLGTSTPEVIQASEARHDATEGFDVTFSESYADVELWAVGPDPASSEWQACGGSKHEPYWWWAMWAPPP
ncbi:MAG: S8 family serine peptidase [Myxococcales bacterium]|nr:S8 family serine peptidase [Myxococcales bacterium]